MNEPPKKRVRVKRERDISTYAELWHGAKILQEKAESDPRGSHYLFMSALVLYAFTIEAYCNAVGPELFGEQWASENEAIERRPPLEKLEAIAERVGIPIDRGRRPWQTFCVLFKLRNDLAHGKSLVVTHEKVVAHVPDRDYLHDVWLAAPWHRYCTKSHADRTRKDIEKFLKLIHDRLPFKVLRLFAFGEGSGSAIVER
ncbi:hypothetical protein PQQ77_25135 [Paraburkholderia strydomiana]|uniref:hypothetical protein n=1 Tax=Paraburkholderia strydomiana TaxID=1245417 RepID=UPI0038B80A57